MSEERRGDGLWVADHGSARRRPGVDDLAVYVLVPLLLTVIESPRGGVAGWLSGYARMAMVGVCIGGPIHLMYSLFWPRVLPRLPSWPARLAGHAATIAIGVLAGGELAARLMAAVWDAPVDVIRPSVWRSGGGVTITIVLLLLVYDHQRARAHRFEQAAQAARLAAMRAQLDALVARTNPHFLFNSLNSVAALIGEDPARAEDMLERLAALFRYALEGARRREVRLAEEVASVRDYLDVEGIRFGARLTTSVQVAEGLDELAVPPLSLQPLVENAIVHGVAPRRGPGRVDVRVERVGERLQITVDDDGDAGTSGASGGTRSALADLRERLRLLHGDAASLEAGPTGGAGWRARVTLPARPWRAEPAS